MKLYNFGIAELQSFANDAARLIVSALANDEIMADKPNEILSQYAIIVYEKGMFGQFLDKLLGAEDGGISMRVVRLKWDKQTKESDGV